MKAVDASKRVVSGMRATSPLHLGHYHGVLKNWVKLQHESECFFFIADIHSLTTHYDHSIEVEQHVWHILIDWLAAGVNPGSAAVFLQSRVPEHAELFNLLSMITPLSWLERAPTYKEQLDRLKDKDESLTYGFLGYPLLQAADILIYRAGIVPVGADQVAHIELSREIARRFNHLYGKEPGFEYHAKSAIKKLGKKAGKLYMSLRKNYVESGDVEALETARALLKDQQNNLSISDIERLFGYLEGSGKVVLPEPQPLMSVHSRFPGLDGQKMSHLYQNMVCLRDSTDEIKKKIRTMPTDPARVRRQDPGNPKKCPVWKFHKIYSDEKTRNWVKEGCTQAGIGCIQCKEPVIEAVCQELIPIQEKARQYEEDHKTLESILAEGCEKAREVAKDTLDEVRDAMGITYR